MYLNEDISNFLKTSHPNKIMMLLMFPGDAEDVELKTIGDKLLLAKAWVSCGKPDDKLDKLKEFLGDHWYAYLNPLTDRLNRLDLTNLLDPDIELLGMKLTKDHYPIVKEILHQKLSEYLDFQGVTGLTFSKDFPVRTKAHKVMVYQFKSKFAPKSIVKVTLDWLGFEYSVKVNFLDMGYSVKNITPESFKDMKSLMYSISESWDTSLLNGTLDLIKFDDIILDCLIDNIKNYNQTKDN